MTVNGTQNDRETCAEQWEAAHGTAAITRPQPRDRERIPRDYHDSDAEIFPAAQAD